MTKKKILHQILRGMDSYKSTGVPCDISCLAVQLTQDVYGQLAARKLQEELQEYDSSIEANSELLVYSLDDPEAFIKFCKGVVV